MKDSFEQLMNICKTAAHDRNACTEGYAQLLRAENIPQILQVWRQNWDDVYRSRYHDIMAKNIVGVFEQSKDLFHASEVFVNEPAERGLLIIASPTQPIEVTGTARAYLFTAAEVTARDNAQVYCRDNDAMVTLRDHSYGKFEAGTVSVYDFSEADCTFAECHTYNASQVVINGGRLIDHGHRRIAAYVGAKVYSDTPRNIEIGGQARLYPLSEYNNIKEQ